MSPGLFLSLHGKLAYFVIVQRLRVVLLATCLICGFPGLALASGNGQHLCKHDTAVKLHITIPNVRVAKGEIVVAVYPPVKKRWLAHHGKLFKVYIPASKPETTTCVALPGPGDYAVAIYADENGNHHLDKNWLGLPKEAYGISKHTDRLWSPPSLKSSLFKATKGTTRIRIPLHY